MVLIIALVVASVGAVTTAALAATCTYDVATIARVDVREFGTVEAGSTQLSYVREGSASPSIDGRGPSTTPSARCVATEAGDDLVNLASPGRTQHILEGEVRPNGTYGGGHRPGTGFPNKSEFPAGWSDDQIMHNISDVATDPALQWRPGDRVGDYWVNGTRSNVDIEVLIRNDQIWTGYPTNVVPNPR